MAANRATFPAWRLREGRTRVGLKASSPYTACALQAVKLWLQVFTSENRSDITEKWKGSEETTYDARASPVHAGPWLGSLLCPSLKAVSIHPPTPLIYPLSPPSPTSSPPHPGAPWHPLPGLPGPPRGCFCTTSTPSCPTRPQSAQACPDTWGWGQWGWTLRSAN